MKHSSSSIENKIFEIKSEDQFRELALEVFRYQAEENLIYKSYIQQIGIHPTSVTSIDEIPFFPVEFFKTMNVVTGNVNPQIIFSSSGTTKTEQSHHAVADVLLYEKSFLKCFELFHGSPDDYCILALLPSYLERDGSSLVYMINDLIKKSRHVKSGFYLHNHDELAEALLQLKNSKQKTILFGVTFALLEFIEKYRVEFPELIVIETGGMKGRRKEIVREELHAVLCKGFGVSRIYSEYGMTELLSQAYSTGNGIFRTPPWMRILIRDINDPLNMVAPGQTGGINVIDLSNIHSSAFIATQDLGKCFADGSFEVMGRFDNSDIRGCNLMTG